MRKFMACLSAVLPFALSLGAQDAPQFRGPGGRGVSKETNLPLKWSAKENVRWKAELPGRGLSNPVVADGRVYVTASTGYEQKREVVLCFDLKTGKKLWERQIHATGRTQCHPKTCMAAPTPVTDGQRVYALFATGDLVCYDKNGDLVWYRSLTGDHPTLGNGLGLAASPTLHGDTLLVCMENVGESFAVGIDILTGVNRWRFERPRYANWVSPTVIDNKGQAEFIFQGPDGLIAHDPATGKKNWSAPKLKVEYNVYASPAFEDGIIFLPAEKFSAVRPVPGKNEPEVLWTQTKLHPDYCSPVASKGRIYVINNGGIVHCADAKNGAIIWTQRLEGTFIASPLVADGKLYCVNEKGATSVLELDGKGKVLATNDIDDTILATPVAADGAIFLRSDKTLYCIGAKK